LYWGTSISPADGPLSIFGDYGRVFIIIFAVLFALCLVAICVAGARVAMLVSRSHQDWEDARDSAAQSISAAVPRYGFAADESTTAAADEEGKQTNGKSGSGKKTAKKGANEKNFRTPLLSRVDGADGSSDAEKAINNNNTNSSAAAAGGAFDNDTLCHVCHRDMEHDSRRRFVPLNNAAVVANKATSTAASDDAKREGDDTATAADGAKSSSKKKDTASKKEKEEDVTQSIATTADTWHQIVLLPCYHRVCKQCILSRAEANASAAAGWGVYSGRLLTNLKQRVMTSFIGGSTVGANSTETSLVILDEEGGGINNGNTNISNTNTKARQASTAVATGSGSAAVMIGGVASNKNNSGSSSSIASVLDIPDVSEEALLGVLGGMTVDSFVERSALKSKQEAEKKRRADQRRQRRANRNNASANAGNNINNNSNNNAPGSSSDSEDEDEPAGATVAGAAARRRRGGSSTNHSAHKKAQCPVCSHEVELVFVPGKVLR